MKHPEAIFVQPTTACNSQCAICPHKDTYGLQPKQDMPEEVWAKILADIIEMDFQGQVGLYLHCEPLRCDTLFEKMADIRDKTKAHTVLSTNGILLHKQNRERLIDAAPQMVHFHPPLTDPQFFKDDTGLKALKNVHAFIEESEGNPPVIINLPRIQDDITTTLETLREVFPGTHIEDRFWAVSRAGSVPEINAKGHLTRFSGKQCVQPKKNFCILHDGSVIVCCNDWKRKTMNEFSNIRLMSIQHIYDTQMKAYRIEFEQGEYGYHTMCTTCAEEMGYEIHQTTPHGD